MPDTGTKEQQQHRADLAKLPRSELLAERKAAVKGRPHYRKHMPINDDEALIQGLAKHRWWEANKARLGKEWAASPKGQALKAEVIRRRGPQMQTMLNALAGAYASQTGRQLARFQQKTEQQHAPQRHDRNTKQALEALTQ